MYAQATMPQFHQRRFPRTSSRGPRIVTGVSKGIQKGIHARNEKCDCIKYLKLGEPACGTGKFLVEILRRKLAVVKEQFEITEKALPDCHIRQGFCFSQASFSTSQGSMSRGSSLVYRKFCPGFSDPGSFISRSVYSNRSSRVRVLAICSVCAVPVIPSELIMTSFNAAFVSDSSLNAWTLCSSFCS